MFSLNCNGRFLYAEKPLVMGIVNLTEDSFYEGSRMKDLPAVLSRAEKMISEGADILDLGAQSTRPGSTRFSPEEELKKLLPAIEAILKKFPKTIISIDTYHAAVAKKCVESGACMINDISGGEMDLNMIETVANLTVPYICMHMKGVPQTMHLDTHYKDLLKEILDYFIEKTDQCKKAGIHDVIVDPGFGFGKNIQQNLFLLKHLSVFKMLEKPIMIGVSRKSTIYKTLQVTPEEALNGTTVLQTIGLLNGTSILRVHDVKQAKEAITLVQAYQSANEKAK